jgi:plastocyanin domain-containing protein
MLEQSVRARLDPTGRQVVDVVVDGGYHPNVIVAEAGIPLRVVFRRQDDDACSERVVFSAPHLDRRLASTGLTTIDLPAQPPGEVRFTCGMGRYRGRIELVTGRGRSLLRRIRDRASRIEEPLGTALVLWICSLPLIVLVGVLAFDATAALPAAAAALVAWVGGCVWAFARSAEPT